MSLWLRFKPSEESTICGYCVAEQPLSSDAPLPALNPWRIALTASPNNAPSLLAGERWGGGDQPLPVLQDRAWVGNHWREVHGWRREAGVYLQLADAGEWLIDLNQRALFQQTITPTDPGLREEIALGPGLILLLAQQGIFCLHASGAGIAHQAHLFLGDSGQGKSTLAQSALWSRMGDDIMPIIANPEGAWALPHFPQLKLAPDAQYPRAKPSRQPLAALYLLAPTPGNASSAALHVERLTPSEATCAIIHHTVASRLFPPSLLASHLRFAAQLARQTPVYRLQYPWGLAQLPAVRSAIAALDVLHTHP